MPHAGNSRNENIASKANPVKQRQFRRSGRDQGGRESRAEVLQQISACRQVDDAKIAPSATVQVAS